MPDALTVIRHAERPTVDFPGGATYQPIIGDDTGADDRLISRTAREGYGGPLGVANDGQLIGHRFPPR